MAEDNKLEEYTVIIDIGEAFVKVGFAGEEKPTSIFPTVIGKPKYKPVMQVEGGSKEIYVGNDAMNKRGVMKISHPISRGTIMDWDAYYSILTHIFYNELRINPEQANILYAENCLTTPDIKKFIARIFLETYKCKSVYIANAPTLALFSAGLVTGIVVESGEGLTRIVPIFEGKIIEHAVQKMPLAGLDVNENLKALLLRTGVNLSGTSALREILREIKEQNCFIALDPNKITKKQDEVAYYSLPDGETISINIHSRVNAPEILFHPELLGLPVNSLPQGIIDAISRVNKDYWLKMLDNIVLTGGNTLFTGFELRLRQELALLIPQLGSFPGLDNMKKKSSSKPQMVNLTGPSKVIDSCPKCGGTANLQESDFCPDCGENIAMGNATINIGTLQTTKYPENCPSCNHKLKEESEYCPFCGNKLYREIVSIPSKLKQIEVPPIDEEMQDFEASEFGESNEYKGTDFDRLINIVKPERRHLAIFNGASILGSLKSFKKLFVTHLQFLTNPDSVYLDFSQIL